MKYLMIVTLAMTATIASAEARGGNSKFPNPWAYNYSREKVAGYKKDYCEDSVGNHIYCLSKANDRTGAFSAEYSK